MTGNATDLLRVENAVREQGNRSHKAITDLSDKVAEIAILMARGQEQFLASQERDKMRDAKLDKIGATVSGLVTTVVELKGELKAEKVRADRFDDYMENQKSTALKLAVTWIPKLIVTALIGFVAIKMGTK